MPETRASRIPALDGLRGAAILLVLVDHSVVSLKGFSDGSFVSALGWAAGALGVNVFFVLSGFLITMLLDRERETTGRIDLRRFYVRRSRRIFPAFYVYLAVVAVSCVFGTLGHIRPQDLLLDVFYVHNFGFGAGNWYVGQDWSLDIEEQFYLLWPAVAIFGSTISTRFAVICIVAEPAIRTAAYFAFPQHRTSLPILLFTRADLLMFGCASALLLSRYPAFGSWFSSARARTVALAAVPALLVTLVLGVHFRGLYTLTIGYAVDGALISAILLTVVRQPDTPFARLVSAPWLRRVGRISYSLYLWQQLFFAPTHEAILQRFPINAVAAFVCAAASYMLVERRFLMQKPAVSMIAAVEATQTSAA